VTVLDDDVVSLKRRNHELLEQQHENENAFALQRAKFMELFKQKEGCMFKTFVKMQNCWFVTCCSCRLTWYVRLPIMHPSVHP